MHLEGFEFGGHKSDCHVPVLVADKVLLESGPSNLVPHGAAIFPRFLWSMPHDGKCAGFLIFADVNYSNASQQKACVQLQDIRWTMSGVIDKSIILKAALSAFQEYISHHYSRFGHSIDLFAPLNIMSDAHEWDGFSRWTDMHVEFRVLQIPATT